MRNLLNTNHGRKAKVINACTNRLAPRRPLQPKPECPLTAVRLQIKAGGYDLIPLHGKIGFKGWRTQPNDDASSRKWWGDSTGIRMYGNDVFVIDIDVNIAEVVKDILDAYTKRWPAFMRGCLRRHSGANKIALIGRGNIIRRQGRTARYFAEPDDTGGRATWSNFSGATPSG